MDEEIPTPEEMETIREIQEDQKMEDFENQLMNEMEFKEGYGYPEPEEKMNAHSFLHRAAFASPDTTRTSFLFPEELGRPLFSVRFLLDMEDIARYYIDPICKLLGLDEKTANQLAIYFKEKRENVTSSGMSNKGFSMNLNVTRKMDSTRQRANNPIENLQGERGKK